MEDDERKLTLDRPVAYQIKVPGHLDDTWTTWVAGLEIRTQSEKDGTPVTMLTCTLDQAALQSLLRRLYSLGLPLISVTWLRAGPHPGRSELGYRGGSK